MKTLSVFLFIYMLPSYFCDGYKILLVFPYPSRSHGILGDGYVRHLLGRGHQVTYITPYPSEKPPENLTEINVSSLQPPDDLLNIKLIMEQVVSMNGVGTIFDFMLDIGVRTLEHENVQRLLNDNDEHFDLVIVEWLFTNLYFAFPAVFRTPYILSLPSIPHTHTLSLIDEPTNPAYDPDLLSTYLPPLTFLQRVEELWLRIKNLAYLKFAIEPLERSNYERIIGPIMAKRGKPLVQLDDIKYNASLALGNYHVPLSDAVRLPQSFKPIGGYHIDSTNTSLPQKLKTVMDNAKNGVIYFSMGSNLKSKDMPEELKNNLLKMFGELNQTVIWKYEEKLSTPENVQIIKWAPQTSILSHANCLLFITHGGLLSTTEAVHFGVPMIGIPMFGDQFNNVERATIKGFAKRVDISYDLAIDLKEAISEMIKNPRYRQRVRELSAIFQDRPIPPGSELLYWIEHVVRTRGAPHLRSPALMIPWYQKYYLDLAALILISIIFLTFSVKYVFLKTKRAFIVSMTKKKN